ncbi:hypothetical protein ACWCQL_32390 [Streptomyces sp. NPDC002073]
MNRRNTALALTVLSGAVLLAAPGTAGAHGDTLKVTVTGHRQGHVTTEVVWENDGDPVTERVAATVNAVSGDGARTAGPWRLVRVPGTPSGWTTAETLPAGRWRVTVEAGFPGLGRGERVLDVTAPVPVPAGPAGESGEPVRGAKPGGPGAGAGRGGAVAKPGVSGGAGASPSAAATAIAAGVAAQPATPSPTATGSSGSGSGAAWFTTLGVAGAAVVGAAGGLLLRRSRTRKRG